MWLFLPPFYGSKHSIYVRARSHPVFTAGPRRQEFCGPSDVQFTASRRPISFIVWSPWDGGVSHCKLVPVHASSPIAWPFQVTQCRKHGRVPAKMAPQRDDRMRHCARVLEGSNERASRCSEPHLCARFCAKVCSCKQCGRAHCGPLSSFHMCSCAA